MRRRGSRSRNAFEVGQSSVGTRRGTSRHGVARKPSTSGLLTQEQLVAVQVLEKNARTPRARLRLAVESDPASLQDLVITNTIGGVQRQKRKAACLLAHDREV